MAGADMAKVYEIIHQYNKHPLCLSPTSRPERTETTTKSSASSFGMVADHVTAIIVKVESGASVRSCCDKPGGLTRNEFRRAVRDDPALRARYAAAIAKWSAPHARSLIHFEEIERRIVAGGAILDILAAGETFPDFTSWRKFLAAYPDYDARYRAAFRRREAGPNARGIVPKYSNEELRQAAAELATSEVRYISVNRIGSGPHARTLMKARHRNSDLCAAIENSLVARISRLKIKDGPMFRPLTSGIVLPTRRTAPRVYEKFVLKRALSQNEIYAAVDAAVPRYFAPYDRDDIIAQTVLEVIEDELDVDMIAIVAKEIISDHFNRARRTSRTKSLDQPLFSDSTLTLSDMITTGWE